MGLTVVIKGGTPKSKTETICKNCKRGQVTEGAGGIAIYCHSIGEFVRRPVYECSGFMEQNKLSLYRLESMAYILDTEKLSKGKPGFVPSKDYMANSKNEKHRIEYSDGAVDTDDD